MIIPHKTPGFDGSYAYGYGNCQIEPFRKEENKMNNDEMLKKAKRHGSESFKKNCPDITENDVYIVWFCKTLQNWKALVSTDRMEGFYVEVTYNGDKHETYIDKYVKTENRCIPDLSVK